MACLDSVGVCFVVLLNSPIYKKKKYIYIYIGILSYPVERLSGGITHAGDRHNSGKSAIQPARERDRERYDELSRPAVSDEAINYFKGGLIITKI